VLHGLGNELALAGVGVARVPELLCAAAIADGRLVSLFPEQPAADGGIYALLPTRRHLPARVRVFLDLLAARHAAPGE
jgi:DNA-binding transcriptional LysR family regulator